MCLSLSRSFWEEDENEENTGQRDREVKEEMTRRVNRGETRSVIDISSDPDRLEVYIELNDTLTHTQ